MNMFSAFTHRISRTQSNCADVNLEPLKDIINVNAITPGYSATENTGPLRADPKRAPAILNRIPAGRWGTPNDLRGDIMFLASTASDYLHGAILSVDGVWLTR